MAGTNKVLRGDDEVYEAVDALLQSGVLVVPSSTPATNPGLQGVKVAGDAATNVLGVSSHIATPVADQANTGTDSDGFPFVNATGVPGEVVTVYSHGIFHLTYTAAAVGFGAPLCAAANGHVRAWVSGTDPADAIVGYCRVVGGMSSAGGDGLVKLVR